MEILRGSEERGKREAHIVLISLIVLPVGIGLSIAGGLSLSQAWHEAMKLVWYIYSIDAVLLTYFAQMVAKRRSAGHSLKCALRNALLRIS